MANGVFPVLLKMMAGLPSRNRRYVGQYVVCFSLAVIVGLLDPPNIGGVTGIVFFLGLTNGIATYAQWKAIGISQSKAALFDFWDDIVTMLMSYTILGEGRYLTPIVCIGIGLSFGAVALFAVNSYNKGQEQQKNTLRMFFYIGVYSVIWGVALFAMRYFGIRGVSAGSFLILWYGGTLLSACVIFCLVRGEVIVNEPINIISALLPVYRAISKSLLLGVTALALCTFSFMVLSYDAYVLESPETIQPFYLVGEMILPTLIGLYIFHERDGLDLFDKVAFAIGIAGGAMVAVNLVL